MNDNVKTVPTYAAIIVGALLILFLGGGLIISFLSAMGQTIINVVNSIAWLLAIVLTLCAAATAVVLAATITILIAVGGVWVFIQITRIIIDEFAKLSNTLSKQAAEAAIDATVIALIALLASLMFYAITNDFLDKFSTVRVLAVCAALFSVCKMLILIPMRSCKITGALITMIVLLVLFTYLLARYQLLAPSGLSFGGIFSAWEYSGEGSRSRPFLIFALGAAGTLLFVSVFYPFTVRGWQRIWKIN
jgi:hypothetical protein